MSNHTRKPRAERTAFDEIKLSFPWDERRTRPLVDALKAEIPYKFRSYDPGSKHWLIWGGYQDLAVDLLIEAFPDAEVPRPASRADGRQRMDDGPFATLHLLPSAPRLVVDAVYRALSKQCHPDVAGGGDERMRELNAAYDTLTRMVSA